MCGLLGFASANGVDLNVCSGFQEFIRHRGPDGEGVWIDPERKVVLLHSRLSIIDLSVRADQPFCCGDTICVFNGEIYNFEELRWMLRSEGCSFSTESDTEVFVRAISHWGLDKALDLFNGMFAAVLFNRVTKKVHLVRDRIGEKPLFYSIFEGTLFFCSEFTGLCKVLRTFGFNPKFDFNKMSNDVHGMWSHSRENTNVYGVFKVPPASYGSVGLLGDSLDIKFVRYWDLTSKKTELPRANADIVEEYREVLIDSVRIRLRSDVNNSLLLSGGLDSSLIGGIIAHLGDAVPTYSIAFDSANSEEAKAKSVANFLKFKNVVIKVANNQAIEGLTSNIHIYDDLSSFDAGFLPLYLACRRIREDGIKVAILGEGSDEINAGYGKFVVGAFPFSSFPRIGRALAESYAATRNSYSFGALWDRASATAQRWSETDLDPINQLCRDEVLHQLPNHLLPKVDRASMAAGVEARVPFLDHRLVELAISIPGCEKFRRRGVRFEEKALLREVANSFLPVEISSARKFGMMLPITELLSVGRSQVDAVIKANRDLCLCIISEKVYKSMVAEDPKSKRFAWLRWRVFITILWIRSF